MLKKDNILRHVAIIMDGNSRWAKQHGLPRIEGHRAGAKNVRHVVEVFSEYNIGYLTLFAFSTENWGRPEIEVGSLLQIFRKMIDSELKLLHEKGVRLCHLGIIHRLPKDLQRKVEGAIELTKKNTGMMLSIAFDYGGRTEITDAVRRLFASGVTLEEIDESSLKENLYSPEMPEPDLIIRTGGDMRLSNFFLWQAAYSELYFTDTLWPDFDRAEIDKALAVYASRERHFGRRQ
jgi:undecaprenyl diphosphate synthase